MKHHPPPENTQERRRHPWLRRIIDHPIFGVVVFFLVFLSVSLVLAETLLPLNHASLVYIDLVNEALMVFFVVELFLRWLVASSLRSFFRRHWIDIIAILPMLRVFRLSRMFLLLRLLRVFSLAALFQRRIILFGSVFEGRMIEYGILLGMMCFALIFGTVGLAQFEVSHSSDLKTPMDAFWKALFSLLAGEYADYPQTLGGRLIFTALLLFGMGFFAMLTGTISAFMIEKIKETAMHKAINLEDLTGHIIICGFSSKLGILISEFMHHPKHHDCDIVLISKETIPEQLKSMGVFPERLHLIMEDFTHMEHLRQAGITRAHIAVILSEAGGNRSTHDIDARTMLAALTIEKLNPNVHTCAEIYHPEYADHLKMGGVDDVVIQGEVSGSLLARAAMQEGLMPFFKDLFSNREGNFLTFIPTPLPLVGKDIAAALPYLHNHSKSVLVAVKPKSGELIVNPSNRLLSIEDELLVIAPAPSATN
jgi:voltage-gated potassium channel